MTIASMRRVLRHFSIAGVAAAAILASSASVGAPRAGGAIVEGLEADFTTLDVLRIGSLAQREVAMSLFDTLFDINAKGEVVPHLAERFSVSADGLRYAIKLHPGVVFHDGTPLDAEAVAFNLNRVRDPKNACRCLGLLGGIDGVRAVDALTVEVTLKSPSVALLAILSDTPGMMVSPAAIRKDPAAIASNPVGTGPFMLKEWTKGDRIVLVRNPNYWRKPLPYLDQVTYRPIANSESRFATMLAGGIQINQTPGAKAILEARRNPKLSVFRTEALGTYHVMMNMQKGGTADVRVRRALSYATDRKLLVKALYNDLFEPAQSPFPKGSTVYPGSVAGFPDFDLDKAKALVREIGTPVEVTMNVMNSPDVVRLSETLQGMWAKAGIKANLQLLEQSRVNESAFSKNFEMVIYRWSGRPDPDLNTYRFFHSKFAPGRSTNFTQYANPEMDGLLEEGAKTLDPAKRKAIYGRVAELLARDLPYNFLYSANFYTVHAKNLRGLEPVPDGLVRLRAAWLER